MRFFMLVVVLIVSGVIIAYRDQLGGDARPIGPAEAAKTGEAADATGYMLIGAGVSSCGAWTADRRNRGASEIADTEWVLGFLSGIGYAGENMNPLEKMDSDGVGAWIDNYCSSRPINTIVQAAKAFQKEHPR